MQTRTSMATVDKALGFLRYFSTHTPEIGLSDLARRAGQDKTTTLRCMTALERNGFVEQHPETKKYRLGLAPINLARIREHSFPLQTLLKPHLDRLVAATGETAHISMLSGNTLVTIAIGVPDRATRVFLDPSEHLPFHATASGLVVAAFMTPETRAGLGLIAGMVRYTQHTNLSPDQFARDLDQIAERGFAVADQTYEQDVVGTARPIFGWADKPVGAVAVAAVASRFDAALSQVIAAALREASQNISRELGGRVGSAAAQ